MYFGVIEYMKRSNERDEEGAMNGYFYIAGIILVLCCLPYVRIFCKRISLYVRLRRICRKRNFKLYGTHFGWLFSPWWYPHHDFVVEGDHEIFPVKLFASKSKTRRLVFTNDGSFYWVKRLMLMSRGIPISHSDVKMQRIVL